MYAVTSNVDQVLEDFSHEQPVTDEVASLPVTLANGSCEISDRHKRVARMIGFDYADVIIAEACDLSLRAVQEIRNRSDVQAYVSRLKDLARLEALERKDRFDDLLKKALQVYEDILNDAQTSPHLKAKVASAVMDRHPDSQFVRGQKTTVQALHTVDSEAITRLKEIALQNNAEVLDVSP